MAQPHVKYNKAVLFAPSLVQQGIMLITDILTAGHKLPSSVNSM